MKRTQASDWLAGAWRYQQGTDGVLANMCQIVLIRVAPSVTTYTTQELAQQIVTQFTCHKSQTVTNIWMILLSYCWLPIFASMRESSKKEIPSTYYFDIWWGRNWKVQCPGYHGSRVTSMGTLSWPLIGQWSTYWPLIGWWGSQWDTVRDDGAVPNLNFNAGNHDLLAQCLQSQSA